jgi:hypothetical protein
LGERYSVIFLVEPPFPKINGVDDVWALVSVLCPFRAATFDSIRFSKKLVPTLDGEYTKLSETSILNCLALLKRVSVFVSI